MSCIKCKGPPKSTIEQQQQQKPLTVNQKTLRIEEPINCPRDPRRRSVLLIAFLLSLVVIHAILHSTLFHFPFLRRISGLSLRALAVMNGAKSTRPSCPLSMSSSFAISCMIASRRVTNKHTRTTLCLVSVPRNQNDRERQPHFSMNMHLGE